MCSYNLASHQVVTKVCMVKDTSDRCDKIIHSLINQSFHDLDCAAMLTQLKWRCPFLKQLATGKETLNYTSLKGHLKLIRTARKLRTTTALSFMYTSLLYYLWLYYTGLL